MSASAGYQGTLVAPGCAIGAQIPEGPGRARPLSIGPGFVAVP